ncbi:MAG: IPT/TIG domain-containing protein [Tannerella sp.]|jgi:DNA-binding beta-propeller fold protein YncE|nr:IPT/TIG domain-containing protein [Tannerella sp.]
MEVKRFLIKESRRFIRGMTLALAVLVTALCFVGCGEKDDDNQATIPPFDSSQPVEISDFTPKEGSVGQRLIIYGKNFGNDTEIIHVFIGGKEAKVIGVTGDAIYCIVPEKAFAGNIEIRIGDGENPVVAAAASSFAYQRKMVTSTLFGYRNERDDQPNGNYADFSQATLFKNDSWMKFDPQNPNHLYIAFDGAELSLIDLQEERFSRVLAKGSNFDRVRSVDFTLDGQYMIIANDQEGTEDPSTVIVPRQNNFMSGQQVLTRYRQCNGGSIHPINGELYFNSYEKGQFYRFDLANAQYFGGTLGVKDYEELFKIQDVNWEFNIRIHPSGNYAYIVVVNQHYILRSDYNWNTKKFTPAYLVCGESRASGYLDAVGSAARLNRPYQGVFVKNPEYAGRQDEYDFYFTDCNNHCIRILTPDGLVSTFAGRGSTSLNTDVWGYVEGDLRLETRFRDPTGLAYDESTNTFYVGDKNNRRIRKIAMEDTGEETEEETEEGTGE